MLSLEPHAPARQCISVCGCRDKLFGLSGLKVLDQSILDGLSPARWSKPTFRSKQQEESLCRPIASGS